MNFRNWILQNFPILEDDFDALTDYELFTKMCSYVIEYSKDNEEMKAKIAEFQAYIDNFDVQDEVDKKIDEMVEDGTFDEIINQTLFQELYDEIDEVHEYQDLSIKPTLFIGDSYTNATPSYATIYKEQVGLSNDKYFKYALGGAGFHAIGTGGKNYIDLLNDAINNMSDAQKNSIKQIIVGTLINDANYQSSATQLKTGIGSFMTLANINFPNATVYVIGCGYRIGYSETEQSARRFMDTVVIPTLMNKDNDYKQPIYIDNSSFWIRNDDYFQSDNLHPNALGQKIIANSLIRALKGNTNVRFAGINTTLTFINSGSENETLTLVTDIENNQINFRISQSARLYNVKNLTPLTYNEVGTWDNKLLHPTNNPIIDIPISVRCYMSANDDNYVQGLLRLGLDNKLYIYIFSNRTFTNIVNFSLYNVSSVKTRLYT